MGYCISEARRLIVSSGKRLLEANLVARTWGNISARIDDKSFSITPSGRSYELLKKEEIPTVLIEDLSYEGPLKPSSEKGIHADCYKSRSDVNFVIHTHQTYATALSIGGRMISLPVTSNVLGERIPVAAYGMPSTKKLRSNVAFSVQNNVDAKAVLLKSHGALCMGSSEEEAFSVAFALENEARDIVNSILGEKYISEEIILNEDKELSKRLGRKAFFVESEVIKAVSDGITKLIPLLDDLCQIAGTSIKVIDATDVDTVLSALKKSEAVLIKGKGAIVVGDDDDEADAVAKVLLKNCISEMYHRKTGEGKPLGFIDRFIQRTFYVKKYKKRK